MHTLSATIGKDQYKTIIRTENHVIIADEPEDLGGSDQGLSPTELLASALGACTCITLRMYVDRKQWQLHSIEAKITITQDAVSGTTNFQRDISFQGVLDEVQKERLLSIANKCPVHKILSNKIEIETKIQ